MNYKITIQKIINTFLVPKFLFDLFYSTSYLKKLLKTTETNKQYNLLNKIKKRIFFFLPNLGDVDTWKEGNAGKYRDFNHFKKFRPRVDILLIKEIHNTLKDKNSSILDLGCNCGRHLRFLMRLGFTNLHGVDIMKSAVDWFYKLDLKKRENIKISNDFFQSFLKNSPARKYDLVFTVGSTIEEIHPSFDIIKESCRVSKKYVFLLIHENSHAYPRFYRYEIRKNRFKILKIINNLGSSLKKNTNISLICAKRIYD
jgi:SAM-dependent methyltransferase